MNFFKLTALLVLSSIIINMSSTVNSPVKAAGSYPPKTQQSQPKTVYSEPVRAKPGVYWYQLDAGGFRADYSGGQMDVGWNGNCNNPRPVDSTVPDDVNLSSWPGSTWLDGSNNPIPSGGVQNVRLDTVSYASALSFSPVGGNPKITSSKTAIISSETGESYLNTQYSVFMNRPNGCPKAIVEYDTPVDIIWAGDVTEEKEIGVNPDSTIGVSQTVQIRANVRTKNYGDTDYGSNPWVDVTNRASETTWESEDTSIATVNSSGLVTGVSGGTVKIHAIWDNGTYRISDAATITVTTSPGMTVDAHDFCTSEGVATFQLVAHLTKSDGRTYDLTSHPDMTWSSSNPTIATIDQSGMVTSMGISGTAYITAHIVIPAQGIDEIGSASINVKVCSGGGGGSCPSTIGPPATVETRPASTLDPNVSGVNLADNRGAEKFNVLQGIPTTESLYTNVLAHNYLYNQNWSQQSGKTTYACSITITYPLIWQDPGPCIPNPPPGGGCTPTWIDKNATENKTYTFDIHRDYSYW
ncbi:hypothetical protein GCM10008018_72540 [Paenibacillus marchantiophytorum]|uniref:BIG2 domain-containing protein n=1 Tax=Paenibacillus marchantiophytorum TaxID=1619310 RepID=A0ABQ1FK93_9BACL|nr:hypothetical protein GCM10008018_72540 [Paenibacillus marchantiophytorum]